MNIPNDIIEHILVSRDVYVVMASGSCIGIYGNIDDAKKNIIIHVLKDPIDFKNYDPKKRYRVVQKDLYYDVWDDRWSDHGITEYSIETWKQNRADGRVDTLYFGFDYYLKSGIIDLKLTSDETRSMIMQWRSNPPFKCIMQEFYDHSTHKLRRICEMTTREVWQAKHGITASYPGLVDIITNR
jgi:hypothetical protein